MEEGKVTWQQWLERWNMTSLKIKAPFLQVNWEPKKADTNAAWELYIELLTRIATQELPDRDGDEKAALESVHSLFPTTRAIIKENGKECFEFTKLAVVVLNQKVRPFTAKWHKVALADGFQQEANCKEFRAELAELQLVLRTYTRMLADMAGVEDLTELEENDEQEQA